MAYERLLSGLLVALGAASYNAWGFLKAWQKSPKKKRERFNWKKAVVTVMPSLWLGFLAGYELEHAGDFLSLLTSGFGIGAAQGFAGLNKYFD